MFLLRVLGPVRVSAPGDRASSSRLTQPRHLALLCYLALARPRGLHARDTLIALLWPEASEQAGRRALRNALYAIRKRLGADALVSVGDGLVGLDDSVVTCDAHELERAVAGVETGGEPLAGLHVSDAPEFEHWLAAERRRLADLVAHATATADSRRQRRPTAPQQRLHANDAAAMYARGHYLFLRAAPGGRPEELFACRDCFERARELDPTFAPAIAGLANFYAVAARRGLLTPFDEVFGKCLELSDQAARMDPTLAIPHVHFGVKALYLDGDWERAGREFALAAALEPDYVEGRRFYGVLLGLERRFADALREMEAAGRLEPDMPHILSSVAAARLAAGDRRGAETALRRTLALDPRHGPARERLIRLLEDDGRYEEAFAERGREPSGPADLAIRSAWLAEGASGYRRALEVALREEADSLEARLLGQQPTSPSDLFAPPVLRLAELYARLGDWRRVKECRLRAVAQRPILARWFDATLTAPSSPPS